jgi:hypothetical protein
VTHSSGKTATATDWSATVCACSMMVAAFAAGSAIAVRLVQAAILAKPWS